jgi:2-phosphosulfolactate phosphatase
VKRDDSPVIHVLAAGHALADHADPDGVTLVVDVLRAGTTIACALHAGARGIIPVSTAEEAMRLGATLDRDSTLLCGERESLRIEGFDLGNSPAEMTPAVVEGKTIVLLTTNGAPALAAAGSRGPAIAASLVTLRASALRAASADRVVIACAGSGGLFSIEDFLCAGLLVEEILRESGAERRLDDGARLARDVARAHQGNLAAALRSCDHGRRLQGLGFDADLEIAADFDRFGFAPILRDGRIVAEPEPASPRAH